MYVAGPTTDILGCHVTHFRLDGSDGAERLDQSLESSEILCVRLLPCIRMDALHRALLPLVMVSQAYDDADIQTLYRQTS